MTEVYTNKVYKRGIWTGEAPDGFSPDVTDNGTGDCVCFGDLTELRDLIAVLQSMEADWVERESQEVSS